MADVLFQCRLLQLCHVFVHWPRRRENHLQSWELGAHLFLFSKKKLLHECKWKSKRQHITCIYNTLIMPILLFPRTESRTTLGPPSVPSGYTAFVTNFREQGVERAMPSRFVSSMTMQWQSLLPSTVHAGENTHKRRRTPHCDC